MPERNLERRFGTIALKKGFITEGQLANALDIQMSDTVRKRKHRVIGTILFEQGHLNTQQIDVVLRLMEQSLSRRVL